MLAKDLEALQGRPAKVVPNKQGIHWSLQLLRESAGLTPSHKYPVQFVRSMVVSVLALAADFGVLVLLKEKFGVYYLLAAAISFFFGVIVNYVLSVKWVFASRKLESRQHEFIIFSIILGVGLALNLAIIAFAVSQLKFDYRVAKGISTVLVFFWNFIARKKLLY